MLALWQVSISSLYSLTCPNRLNTRAADRATGIIYTDTQAHIDNNILTYCMYTHKYSLYMQRQRPDSCQPTCDAGLVIFITMNKLLCYEKFCFGCLWMCFWTGKKGNERFHLPIYIYQYTCDIFQRLLTYVNYYYVLHDNTEYKLYTTKLQVIFSLDCDFQGQTLEFKYGSMEDSNKPSNYVSKLVKLAPNLMRLLGC